MLMLCKCLDEGMSQLEALDFSYIIPNNANKLTGTPVYKKKTDMHKLLSGVAMKIKNTQVHKLAVRGCDIGK
jgi:hypothetical protein